MAKIKAVCGSRDCTKTDAHQIKNNKFVEKKVLFSAIFCPDCCDALRWVKDDVTKKIVLDALSHASLRESNRSYNLNERY